MSSVSVALAAGLTLSGLAAVPGAPWRMELASDLPALPGLAGTATAATVVRLVSRTGSDTGDGSRLHPWRTIQHAVDAAPRGALIVVRGGRYAGFTMTRPGLAVAGAWGESVVVTGGPNVVLIRGVVGATIRNLTITGAPRRWGAGIRVESSAGVVIERDTIRDNHSFGIKVRASSDVTIRGNDIHGNDTGIELSAVGDGIIVRANQIHDNDSMVTSSRGGNGIVFTGSTGRVTVTGNRLWGNRAPHLSDPGYDGGAFEVYAASNLWIEDNVLWDNNNVMETGTNGPPCSNITFDRNVIYAAGSVPGQTEGMILRCASQSLIAHNVFDGLDGYAFYVAQGGEFAGPLDDLAIVDNIVVGGRSYSIAGPLPGSVVIDYNLSHNAGSTAVHGDHLAYLDGHGNMDTIAELRSSTGYDGHGIQADPLFVDRAARDYRLTPGSPAIDAGTATWLDTTPIGSGPDIGRFEWGP